MTSIDKGPHYEELLGSLQIITLINQNANKYELKNCSLRIKSFLEVFLHTDKKYYFPKVIFLTPCL